MTQDSSNQDVPEGSVSPVVSRPHVTDISIIIPLLEDQPRLGLLIPEIISTIKSLRLTYEILVVSYERSLPSLQTAEAAGAKVIIQGERRYGKALITGFRAAAGKYILSMDGDSSHHPEFIRDLWEARTLADVVIASRYVPGGSADMPKSRVFFSKLLNRFFGSGLSIPVRDSSSGFRLYRATVCQEEYVSEDMNVLQEILVRTYAQGWSTREVPFVYKPDPEASPRTGTFSEALAYLRTFWSLWKLRNSILCADYDDRAHDSRIPLQRYWQRERHRHITDLIANEGAVLDVGCGSSRIIQALPPKSLALDILIRKIRYARKFGTWLIHGSGFALPVRDESFPCVLCSQVIEHVPKESPILSELCRTLAPGGRLVLGTPDYDNWQWVVTEKLYGWFAPGAYADEHIAHYSRRELTEHFESMGYKLEAVRYILQGELILAFRKPA